MEGCLACDLAAGREPLPGGTIADEEGWIVEHCVGPLGVGTLVVKPERHLVHVAELTSEEASAMGRILYRAAQVVTELAAPDQVYLSLWSHAGRRPGHIHYVVQPVDLALVAKFDAHGPSLQSAMFDGGELPDPAAVEDFAIRARAAWVSGASS